MGSATLSPLPVHRAIERRTDREDRLEQFLSDRYEAKLLKPVRTRRQLELLVAVWGVVEGELLKRSDNVVTLTWAALIKAVGRQVGWDVNGRSDRDLKQIFRFGLRRTIGYLIDMELVEERDCRLKATGEGLCMVVRVPAGVAQSVKAPLTPRRPACRAGAPPGAGGRQAHRDEPAAGPVEFCGKVSTPPRESSVLLTPPSSEGRACASRVARGPAARADATRNASGTANRRAALSAPPAALPALVDPRELAAAIAAARTAAGEGGGVPRLRQLAVEAPSLAMAFAVVKTAWELLRSEAGLPTHTRLSSSRFCELLVNVQLYDRWFLGAYQGEACQGRAALALLDLIETCAEEGWRPLPVDSSETWLTTLAADPAARTKRMLRHYRTRSGRGDAGQPWLAAMLANQNDQVVSLAHLSCRLGQMARSFRAEAREAEGRGPRKGRRVGTRRAQLARARRARRGYEA